MEKFKSRRLSRKSVLKSSKSSRKSSRKSRKSVRKSSQKSRKSVIKSSKRSRKSSRKSKSVRKRSSRSRKIINKIYGGTKNDTFIEKYYENPKKAFDDLDDLDDVRNDRENREKIEKDRKEREEINKMIEIEQDRVDLLAYNMHLKENDKLMKARVKEEENAVRELLGKNIMSIKKDREKKRMTEFWTSAYN